MLQSILFTLVFLVTVYFAVKEYGKVKRNIQLGKEHKIEGDIGQRWRNVLLVAFGQKKMFKRMIPAVLHFFIYTAFIFTQIEVIEIIVDGFFGVHRFFADKIGFLYPLIISTIEVLSVLAFVATIIFLARRNLLKVPRLVSSEMTGWPKLDANLILIGELLLIIGIFTMNGADVMLQQIDPVHFKDTGYFAFSSTFAPVFFGGISEGALLVLERFGWWLHLLVVFAFILYLPSSKHLHIFLAFPNVYFSKLTPRGQMENMPEIMNEVKSMMGLVPETETTDVEGEEMPDFGSNDVFSLSWKNIMDAYSCTECGRCTSMCPANITGKKLSPRKIMMDIRDRAEEVGRAIDSGDAKYLDPSAGEDAILRKENFTDGKSLFDSISREEIHACTTCNACVEACPVLIDPLEPILKLRRYEILTESAGPPDWLPMFNSLENGGSVWQVTTDREQWTKDETT